MKKRFVIGVGAVVGLASVLLGPELLDLYRLMSFIETSSAAYEAEGPWPHLTDVCTGCHGVKGNSQHQAYPSLAGQPATYLAAQLRNFATGQRAGPNMGPLAMTLSEAETKVIVSYFAGQVREENDTFKPDAAMRERGKQLVASRGCAACHGEQLEGRDPFPRLAGQGYDYLVAQLDAYASGVRSEPSGTMKALSVAASAEERRAMAAYLASVMPVAQQE
jgi:cytochrome c553